MTKLKPCEKCGFNNIIAEDSDEFCGVRCTDCGYQIVMDTLEMSVGWWNTRAIEKDVRKLIEYIKQGEFKKAYPQMLMVETYLGEE